MANQLTINIGAAANDGTGDPLRTAFNEVNLNFANVWATGLPNSNVQFNNNRILTVNTNANLVLAPNGTGIVQSNVSILPSIDRVHNLGSSTKKWDSVYANYLNIDNFDLAGDLTVGGNLTVEGDTIQIGNIVTDTKTIQLSNTAASAAAANGSGITVGANDNIATWLYNSTSNSWVTNIAVAYANGQPVGGQPAGSNTQIQFNDNGVFGSNALFIFNKANGNLAIPGNFNTYANVVSNIGTLLSPWNHLYTRDANFSNLVIGNVINAQNIVLAQNLSANNVVVGNITTSHNVYGNTGTFYGDQYGDGAIYIGTPAGTVLGSDVVMQITANSNSYSQINFQNINSGNGASGDYIITGDRGDDSTYYLDLGLASSNHADSEFFGDTSSKNDGYLYVTATDQAGPSGGVGNLILGSTNGVIKMFVGNTAQANVIATINSNGISVNGNIIGNLGNITNLDSLNFTVENISALVGNNGVNIGAGGFNNLVVLPTDVLIQNVPLTVAGNIISTVAGGLYITANTVANGTAQIWNFGTDGRLTFPGTPRIDTDANNFEVQAAENISFEANAVVNIYTDTSGTTYQWQFGNDGNLTAPGNIITTGNVSGNTAGYAIGYRDIPQVSFTGNATIATTDAGKHFYSTQSTDYILTIANNASQGFQTGAAITIVNQGTGNITVAQGSGVTLYLAGNATSGNRTLATFGMATIMKVATDTWFINGTGVS